MMSTKKNDGHGLKALDAISVMTLRDHVHRTLRQAILSGKLRTEDRVNERMIADQLGVSTTPVKEALRQLESDGLVVTIPRRGVIIRFDFGWAEEMILARAALESTVARLAAQRADHDMRSSIAHAMDAIRIATDSGSAEELIARNETFHERIHEAASSSYLRRLIDRQHFYDTGMRQIIHSDPSERALALAEHCAIGTAIIDQNQQAAASAMHNHVMRAGETYLARIFRNDEGKAID